MRSEDENIAISVEAVKKYISGDTHHANPFLVEVGDYYHTVIPEGTQDYYQVFLYDPGNGPDEDGEDSNGSELRSVYNVHGPDIEDYEELKKRKALK